MPVIRTNNGSILLKNGLPSCTCCTSPEEEFPADGDGFDYNFLAPEACNCAVAQCYNGNSPITITTAGGIIIGNLTPNTNRFTTEAPFIQYPIINPNGTFSGQYYNIIGEPSVVRITGIVAGGLRIVNLDSSSEFAFDEELEPSEEGDYECGKTTVILPNEDLGLAPCVPPRRGVFPVNFQFALRPNSWLRAYPYSELACTPYAQLKIRKISDYPPPAP